MPHVELHIRVRQDSWGYPIVLRTIQKERLVRLEIIKLNPEYAIHERAPTMVLPGNSSGISLSTATPSPVVKWIGKYSTLCEYVV